VNIAAVVTDLIFEGDEAGWGIAREARKRDPTVLLST
jgi:hypothetical protein